MYSAPVMHIYIYAWLFHVDSHGGNHVLTNQIVGTSALLGTVPPYVLVMPVQGFGSKNLVAAVIWVPRTRRDIAGTGGYTAANMAANCKCCDGG